MQFSGIVFVVENNADHIYQLEQAFRQAALPCVLKIARYGNEAVLYLKGVGIYADRLTYPLPRLIILDLDLPDGSALAVLGWIRQQPDLFGVSVLTISNTANRQLLDEARNLGSTASFNKSDFNSLIYTVQSSSVRSMRGAPRPNPVAWLWAEPGGVLLAASRCK